MRPFPALFERKSGTLHVSAHAVEFVPDSGSNGRALHIPVADLQLGMAGENTAFYLLHRAGAPELAISVTDREVLHILSSFGVRGAAAILQRAERRRTRRRWLIGSFAGVTALIVLGIPYLISKAPVVWIERLVSPGAEKRIGQVISSSVDMGSVGGTDEVRQLVEFLQASNAELRGLEIAVRVNPDSSVNAYAMPGGIMVVNAGLIRHAESIEEVLAVMAHELGHIRQRHALRNMTSNLGFSAGAALLGLFVGTDAMLWVFKGGDLALLANSREHEREADQLALSYLRSARVSPEGAVAFFDRMRAHELSGQVGTALSILSTHPLSEERLTAMKDLVAAHPHRADARIPVTLKQLQAAVR